MDAEEFLTSLLDKIEDYAKACGKEKIVRDSFYGCFARQMIPDGCPHKRESDEQFISLQLDVNGKKSVEDSLATFFESEVFSDYLCEQCDQRYDTTRRCRIKSLPQTLFVQCKRFEFNMDTMRRFKITDEFQFPNKLDLSKYMREGTPAPEYTLVGVVVHSGTADSGHYYSYIRDRASPEEKWYWFNDGSVQPFNPDSIPTECYGGMGTVTQYDPIKRQSYQTQAPKIHSAYLLVYEQLDKNTQQIPLEQSEAFIPAKLRDSIWEDNENFLTDLSVFNVMFFDSVVSCVKKHVEAMKAHADNNSGDEAKMEDDKHNVLADQLSASAKVLSELVFNVMIHSTSVQQVKRAVETLIKAYECVPLLCSWFIDMCARTKCIEELMSRCPVPKMRQTVLPLIRVAFVHACKEHEDIINKYNEEDEEAEMEDDDEPKQKKNKKKDKDPLLADWPTGEAASPVTRFMDSYLKKLRTLGKMWRTFADYFTVIEAFAMVGAKEREYLLSRHTVAMLIDLYMYEESPLVQEYKLKREHLGDKKSSPDFTKLFDALYACVLDCEPLSSFFPDAQRKGVVPSPLLIGVDRDLLFFSKFIDNALNGNEASPGLSKILCSCCVGSISKTKIVLKSAMNDLEVSENRNTVMLLFDLKDDVRDERVRLIINELAEVTGSVYSGTTNNWTYNNTYANSYGTSYVTDKEKGEALMLMAELIDKEKSGTAVVDRVYDLRDKWLSSCLVTNTDPVVRQCALLLLTRCMQVPETVGTENPVVDKERASGFLASLVRLISTAERSVVPPKLTANQEIPEGYDWRLLEFAKAIKECLVDDKQFQEFGAHLKQFASLISTVDGYRRAVDKSKWALVETLLFCLNRRHDLLAKVIESDSFLESLRHWTLDYVGDNDKDVARYCTLVNMVAQANSQFLVNYLKDDSYSMWVLVYIGQRVKEFPESSALVLSLMSYVMTVPKAAQTFVFSAISQTISKYDVNLNEMFEYIKAINMVKQQFEATLSAIFWSDIIKPIVEVMQKTCKNFYVICELVALFASGCPDSIKGNFMRYFLSCYNAYKFSEVDDDDDDDDDDDVKKVDDDKAGLKRIDVNMETILQAFCSNWKIGASCLFSAFAHMFTYRHSSSGDAVDAMNAMLVNCDAVDRIVRVIFDQGIATPRTDDPTGASHQLLFGMSIAYVAICNRTKPGLPQFIKDLRAQLSLKPEDPAFNFGAEHIACVIINSIFSDRYTEEAESLLADCFAKSCAFNVSKSLASSIEETMKEITECLDSDHITALQKLYILTHSPVIAGLLSEHLSVINVIACDAGDAGSKYFTYISSVVTPPPPPTTTTTTATTTFEQKPIKDDVPPPPYELQGKGNDSDDDDDDDDDNHHPVGLPPSDDHTEMN